jgi:hypothetical protein
MRALNEESVESAPDGIDALVAPRRTSELDLLQMLPNIVPLLVPGTIGGRR